MQATKKKEKSSLWILMLILAAAAILLFSAKPVQGATSGFVTVSGKTYYYDSNGSKHTGWLKLNGYYYYFNKTTGVMTTGWMKNSAGSRFFYSNGKMVTGWLTTSGGKRYFDTSNGIMTTGWKKYSNGKYRYFASGSGIMATGWLKNSAGKLRYFNKSTGIMYTGWFTSSTGGKKYFAANGIMATGSLTLGDYIYTFSSTGWLLSTKSASNSTCSLNYTSVPVAPTGYVKLVLKNAGTTKWASSNTSVVKISSNSGNTCMINGIAPGNATITATYGGKSYKCTVKCSNTITIPEGMGTYCTYMGWQCITYTGSDQYKLMKSSYSKFNSEGFGINNKRSVRYAIALTQAFGSIGDYVVVTFGDGSTLKCIIGDFKSYNNSDVNVYGHGYGKNVLEFIVNKNTWYNTNHPNPGTATCHPEWTASGIKSITRLGINFFTDQN